MGRGRERQRERKEVQVKQPTRRRSYRRVARTLKWKQTFTWKQQVITLKKLNYPNARHNAWAAAPLKRTRTFSYNRILSSFRRLIKKHVRRTFVNGGGNSFCFSRIIRFLMRLTQQHVSRYHSSKSVANMQHFSTFPQVKKYPINKKHARTYIYIFKLFLILLYNFLNCLTFGEYQKFWTERKD